MELLVTCCYDVLGGRVCRSGEDCAGRRPSGGGIDVRLTTKPESRSTKEDDDVEVRKADTSQVRDSETGSRSEMQPW